MFYFHNVYLLVHVSFQVYGTTAFGNGIACSVNLFAKMELQFLDQSRLGYLPVGTSCIVKGGYEDDGTCYLLNHSIFEVVSGKDKMKDKEKKVEMWEGELLAVLGKLSSEPTFLVKKVERNVPQAFGRCVACRIFRCASPNIIVVFILHSASDLCLRLRTTHSFSALRLRCGG